MDALVVVHTETPYLELHRKGSLKYKSNKRVFDRIGRKIGQEIRLGNRVYYIPGECDSPASELIYPDIRKHFPLMKFVSGEGINENYFLKAKELLINEGVESVGVCGVTRYSCVSDVHNLFIGKLEFELTTLEGYMKAARKYLGWSEERFREVFNHRLDSRVLEELCI